ncbi:HET-domain-containing protein, partial [Trematosphaeria pertusa]
MIHRYVPLNSPEHIRILVLEPSLGHDAPLCFSFQQADLEALQGEYDAISYTWGEPKLIFPLYNDDGWQVFVTENLDRALRRFRHKLDKRWLWADAVCINQSDNKEKGTQIPLMARIFRGARRVLAWLGPGGGENERGMRLMDRLSRRPSRMIQSQLHLAKNAENTLEMEDESNAHAIGQFLSMPWFNRLWIIQECVFNNDLTLICGASEMSLSRFLAAIERCKSDGLWGALSSNSLSAIVKLAKLWKLHSMAEHVSTETSTAEILEMVNNSWLYDCSDDRDRIYALYSMATNIAPLALADTFHRQDVVLMDVDYSLDVLETYRTFA